MVFRQAKNPKLLASLLVSEVTCSLYFFIFFLFFLGGGGAAAGGRGGARGRGGGGGVAPGEKSGLASPLANFFSYLLYRNCWLQRK